jgi:saccharopine dehydrogenase-like NADP-dependent oxidoreductase
MDDLGFNKKPDQLIDLFNSYVPVTRQDFVIIYAQANGIIDEKKITKSYYKKIISNNESTAMQTSTASGVCAVMDMFANGYFNSKKGFIKQEDISFTDLTRTKYGNFFLSDIN